MTTDRGLYRKYDVHRLDGTPSKHDECALEVSTERPQPEPNKRAWKKAQARSLVEAAALGWGIIGERERAVIARVLAELAAEVAGSPRTRTAADDPRQWPVSVDKVAIQRLIAAKAKQEGVEL